MRNAMTVAGLLVALASAGCVIDPNHSWDSRRYKPDNVLGPGVAQPGSEWSYVRRDSGSYGDGVSHVSWKSLPVQTWQGRPHYAYQGPEATILIDQTSGAWAAQVKDGKPLVGWDPPLGFHWPMWVGESWSTPYRVTNYGTNKSAEMRASWTVESHETVNVPAGSFRTFKILYSTPTLWGYLWWSPELGVYVKSRVERLDGDPAGPGVRESDLLRQSIKR